MRDALRQHEADGLVSIQARLGARVKAVNYREFKDLCGLRLALEIFAAAINRTDDDLREMKYALGAMGENQSPAERGPERTAIRPYRNGTRGRAVPNCDHDGGTKRADEKGDPTPSRAC